MALPIDVGPPTFTNRTFTTTFNGTNFSTAIRAFLWDDNFGGIADEDIAVYFGAPSGIHNQSAFDGPSPTLDTAHLRMNLHLLNPIGYNNKAITQVLLDFLVEQMHVGHGSIRLLPSGDGSGTWIASSGGAKWACVDEPVSSYSALDHIAISMAAAAQELLFPAIPANASSAREAIVCFVGLMTKGPSGSDEGLGFGFQMKDSGGANISRKLIADMYANGDLFVQRVKLDRIDQTAAVFNAGKLNITAEYGTAGASPNPYWRIYALEMLVYYSINEPTFDVVDAATFSALDATYATHLLDFDAIDTSGYEALLDILAHAPELFVYVDYAGKLRLGRIGAYTDTPSPRVLSTEDGTITEITRGPYRVDERYANAVELRWGVTIPHSGSGSAQADPTNQPTDRGNRKYRRGARGMPVAGWEDTKVLARHFIRRDSNKDVAESCARMYLHLWGEEDGEDVTGIDLSCPYACSDVEPGDVVAITAPELGLAGKAMRCVEKSLDLARDRVLLVCYDVENTL